jgi:hypothetical protein
MNAAQVCPMRPTRTPTRTRFDSNPIEYEYRHAPEYEYEYEYRHAPEYEYEYRHAPEYEYEYRRTSTKRAKLRSKSGGFCDYCIIGYI